MAVEGIESENVSLDNFSIYTEEEPKVDWNGRSVSEVQLSEQFKEVRDLIFLSSSTADKPLSVSSKRMNQSGKYSALFATQNCPSTDQEIDFFLCGEKVDGEVSASVKADTEGNKSAEVEVKVSNKDGTVSGSASGSMSQDKDGNTKGEVKAGVKASF
jgi:hypothetical protein